MQLPEPEIEHFYQLYKPLLVYTNQRFQITPGMKTPEDIEGYPFAETFKVREKLYQEPDLIDKFIADNSNNLSAEDIAIVKELRNFVKVQFYIFRYLKNYTLFLSIDEPCKTYGVLALNSSFQEMFGFSLPRVVETVLLPFKGKIVYDGLCSSANLSFGSNYRQSINDSYQEAKSRFGIVTSLELPAKELETSKAAKLKVYLKNERNRELYWHEIQRLVKSSPDLELLYYQEIGKAYAKKYGKRLREIGLADVWMALFEEMPIASGTTKSEVEKIVKQIIPEQKREFVYIFHLKGKSGV